MDHCTGWPDGWPIRFGGAGAEWAHCCLAHDQFYAGQTSLNFLAYLGAHYDLATCVASASWLMAVTMFMGLCTLGAPYLIHRHNKYKPGDLDRKH